MGPHAFYGVIASFTDDCTHLNQTTLSRQDGYLALFPRSSRSDTDPPAHHPPPLCPWVLIADPGRRFNISWRLPASGHDSDITGAAPLPEVGLPSAPDAAGAGAICASSWRFVDAEVREVVQYAACVSNIRKPQERTFVSKGSRLEIHFTGRAMQGGGGATGGMQSRHRPLPVLHYKGE